MCQRLAQDLKASAASPKVQAQDLNGRGGHECRAQGTEWGQQRAALAGEAAGLAGAAWEALTLGCP